MDVIDRLPDSLIIHILSLLSDKEAKATTVLSKNWLRINDSITLNLYFDESRIPSTEFPSFVHRVIRRGTTDIRSVSLCLDSLYDADQTQLWIQAMEARNVKEIYLSLRLYVLIPELLNCNTIEVLHIFGFVHLVLPPFINLPSLKILDLHLQDIDFGIDGTVPKLLSGCLALEEFKLVIHSSTCTGILVIQSPRLSKFEVRFCGLSHSKYATCIDELWLDTPAIESLDVSFQSIVPQLYLLSTMPLLSEVKVAVKLQEGQALDKSMCARMGFLKALANIKRLSFCSTTMELLSCGEMAELPLFLNVTKLAIGVRQDFRPTMQLLKHTPNLEKLVLQLIQKNYKAWELVNLDGPPPCLLTSLKKIKLNDFRGSKMEIIMAKYFLRHGARLQTMKISIHRPRLSPYRIQWLDTIDYLTSKSLNADSVRQKLSMTQSTSVACELIIT
ncbi:hypothetical protein QQ045_002168 [Rhodiola kirilowii]